MKKPALPDWVLTRKFAIAASVAVHVGALGLFVFSGGEQSHQKEVVIEFAPSERVLPERVKPEAEKVVDISGDAHVAQEKVEVRPKAESKPSAAPQAAALNALLAMDLSGLRTDVVQTGLKLDGPAIQAAGFAPLEPSIHLTDSEVDSLVTEERDGAKVSRKRGIKGREREPSACFPPPR